MKALVILTVILCTGYSAYADFYKYTSSDGVECYTDSPKSRKAVLVLRDTRYFHKEPKKRETITQPVQKNPANDAALKNKTPLIKSKALPVNGVVTSLVGSRHDPFDGLIRNHNGIDIAVPEGTPVMPVAPGYISYSGVRNGYGNIVIMDHGDGTTTLYAHNNMNLVSTGMRVDCKTPIAYSGSTGRSTGPHLHFEAWRDGENITASFLGDDSVMRNRTPIALQVRKKQILRKVVMADGSILLTNLPLFHP